MKVVVLAAFALVFGGCCSVEVAESPLLGKDVEAHVLASNYGWTLFGWIPLICGNTNEESWCPVTLFKNETTLGDMREKVVRVAAARNCDLTDVMAMDDNNVIFDFYYIPVPWVLVYKEANISANLVRKEGTR